MRKIIISILIFCAIISAWFLLSEIYTDEARKNAEKVIFEVKQGESAAQLAERLEKEGVIRNAWLFKKYLILKGIDKKINIGEFEVQAPITLARVAQVLSQPGINERVITILPGWDLRDIAGYFNKEGIASPSAFYRIVGRPAENYQVRAEPLPKVEGDFQVLKDKPWQISYEGYLAPETYRVYKNAKLGDIILKLVSERDRQITEEMYEDIQKAKRTVHEVLTMASILEREVKFKQDKPKVADILWRRYDKNWALQVDSSVHYALGKRGEVFTTKEERDINSPWNTYKYIGLPLGPICNPSLESIQAAIYPEKNKYWYFLTTNEGEVKYAETLEEHNQNRQRHLR